MWYPCTRYLVHNKNVSYEHTCSQCTSYSEYTRSIECISTESIAVQGTVLVNSNGGLKTASTRGMNGTDGPNA